ncbi:ABC transporter ATP-binding protein [Facklamia miroungae]|uniref:ATP-binding cassette, subfamily B n=1 Tax=Facklamia miroungae TaxID=120956 RepID=A0A1G7PWX4_9LACT|nr:ABC transporter ATP-binding protein [Facklamia miroungae]NKZ28833.1 ABC transporter ATP-binding protein [Facklamia miroungae]SDF89870.1 ATP-binding cassette, subfamily B [Facklamia miroungae]
MIKIFKRLSFKELGVMLTAIILIIASVWVELKVPGYMSEITQLLQNPQVKVSDIYDPGSKMIGLSVIGLILSILVVFLSARLAASFASELRRDVFDSVMDYSTAELQDFSIPSLLTRTTNDIVQIQMFLAMGLQIIVRGPMMALMAVGKISTKNVEWLWVTFAALALMLTTIIILLSFVLPKQKLVQGLTDRLNRIMRESLSGMRVIRAYNAEDYQTDKFSEANQELTGINLFIYRSMSIMNPLMMMVSNGLTLGVYWVGAYLISAAVFQEKIVLFSDMIVFSSYGMQVVIGFMMMTMIFIILPRTMVSARRVTEVLDTNSSLIYPSQALQEIDQGSLIFKDVSFAYPDAAKPVLEKISFQVEPGQTLAFIGSTGSGKSSLINLIPRLFDVTKGDIILNGHSIKDYPRQRLNEIIGYVPQRSVLFSGTIQSNIDFGDSSQSPLDEAAIWEAIDIAQAKDFVSEKEEQLNSHVAQNGTNFSGGQKQRLAIARAIARKPQIIIFDDSFSALDYQTDRKLRQILLEKTKEMTKIIVGQRISTIMDADQIIVIEKGQIVGKGSHKELLETNKVYQEIAYSQLNKEELDNGK